MREGLVLALVRERAASRLVVAFPEAKVLQDCEATDRALGASGQSVLIVDPTVVGVSTDWLISLRETVPGTGFVIYAELEPTVFAVLAELVRNGFTDVVLRGYDDAPRQIGRLVDELKSRPLALRVLEELRPQLERTSPALHAAVSAMFRKPQLYRTTSDLARTAQMSVRAVFRHIDSAGVTSARRLIAAARIMRAFSLLAEGKTAHEVADRLRYASSDQMCLVFVELTGYTPAEVKRGVDERTFRERVVASLYSKPKESQMAPAELGV